MLEKVVTGISELSLKERDLIRTAQFAYNYNGVIVMIVPVGDDAPITKNLMGVFAKATEFDINRAREER